MINNTKELYEILRNCRLTTIGEMTYDAENDNIQFTDVTTGIILLVTVGNNTVKIGDDYYITHDAVSVIVSRFNDIQRLLKDLIGTERYTYKCVKRNPTTPAIDTTESPLFQEGIKDAIRKHFTETFKEAADNIKDRSVKKNFCDMTTREFFEAYRPVTPDCKGFSYDAEANNIEYIDRVHDKILLVTLDSEPVKVKDKYRVLTGSKVTLNNLFTDLLKELTALLGHLSFNCKVVSKKEIISDFRATRDLIGTDTSVVEIAESLLDNDEKKDAMKKYVTGLIKEVANDMLDKNDL